MIASQFQTASSTWTAIRWVACRRASPRAWLQPSLAPALPIEERGDWALKLSSLKAVFLPLFIVFLVLGAIFGGFATPTEAAALGVFGALVASAVHRKES